ncbi:MAG: hypothetical protein KBF76_17005 [Verrucomicrobiales bacterium]|nr:hypothetical protein [Verrucomicrobiales bacterium]
MSESVTASERTDPIEEFPDHVAHLRTIRSLVSCLAEWHQGYSRRLDEAIDAEMSEDGGYPETDPVGLAIHEMEFVHAAQSLAFITTIAAFVESLFKECLPAMGGSFKGSYLEVHPRFIRYGEANPSFWDPTKPTTKGDKIATMIREILEGSGLIRFMIPDFTRVLDAIFKYRNQMVHNGYEWSPAERKKFARTIEDEGWSEWFSISTVDGAPWYFTINGNFSQECLELCDRSVLAFAGLIRDDWERYRNKYGL